MGGMAWAFDIRKKVDPLTGKETPIHWNDYTPLLIAKPVRFEFDAKPRDVSKVQKVREMWATAKQEEEREQVEHEGEYKFAFPKGGLHSDSMPGVEDLEKEDGEEREGRRESESRDEEDRDTARDSSPEPGLSFSLRSESSEGELDESEEELELPIVFEKGSINTPGWKTEPMMTVIEVPGAWRWA